MAGDIDGFADEEEAGGIAGFEGAGVEIGGIDAARGDFGFFKSLGADGMKLPAAQAALRGFELGVAPAIRLRNLNDAVPEPLRQCGAKGVAEGSGVAARLRLEQRIEDACAGRERGREIYR